MRLVFYGRSAFALMMSVPTLEKIQAPVNDIAHTCSPTAASLAYARRQFPQLPQHVHLLSNSWRGPSDQQNFSVHRTRCHMQDESLLKVGSGLYIASPELCLAQIARSASLQEIILLGSALCGSFQIEPDAPGGLVKRQPVSSIASLRKFADSNRGMKGVSLLRQCLDHLNENAASPPEIFLRMVLTLPGRLGGFGMTDAQTNHRLELSRRGQKLSGRKTLVPDLFWPDQKIAIEYDSDAFHLSGRQLMLDATKRLALEAEGCKVITVTSPQLGSPELMTDVAKEAFRSTGKRHRTRSERFPAAQRELFSLNWSLSSIFEPLWLQQRSADSL